MKFNLLNICLLIIYLSFVRAHEASLESQIYWNSILQNDPMPKIIKDRLYTKANDNHKDFSSASKDQLKDQPSNIFLYGTDIYKDSSSPSKYQVNDQPSNIFLYGGANDNHKDSSSTSKDQFKDQPSNIFLYGAANDIHKDSSSPAKDQPSNIFLYGSANDIHKDSSSASKDKVKDLPSNVFLYGAANDNHKDSSSASKDQPSNIFLYETANDIYKDSSSPSNNQVKDQSSNIFLYGAANDQVKYHPKRFHQDDLSMHPFKNDPNMKLLFSENNLLQGVELKLHFTKNDQKAPFLPRKISDSVPFSSEKLPEIYDKFSVKPNSMEAEIMKQTLKLCEHKGIEGGEFFCATSLESMIDFSTTKLGKQVKAISSVVNAKESTPSQMYKIDKIKELATNKAVVCHIQNYAYAVFYCHISVGTRLYVVSLDGADGTKVKSVAVCHTNTSKWNPKHVVFQLLKVTPGTIAVCHFLPEDHVLWVPY